MTRLNVYLPDHVRRALASSKGALTDLLASLLKELVASGDSSLLPVEERILTEASRSYHVPLEIPEKLQAELEERARKEKAKPSFLASALIMNYALRDREVRASHASYFPQGEETRKFVEDGDKSHLRALGPVSEGWRPSSVALLGSAAADLLSSLGFSEQLNEALSAGPERAPRAISSLLEEIRGMAEKGKAYDELRRDLDEKVRENEELAKKEKELEDRVKGMIEREKACDQLRKELESAKSEGKSLSEEVGRLRAEVSSLKDKLKREKEAHKKDMNEAFDDFNGQLKAALKQRDGLQAQVRGLKAELDASKERGRTRAIPSRPR